MVSATPGSAARSSLAWLVGGARKITLPVGAAGARARTNGRCQMTSPMPGLTWITAVGVTLIAAKKGCDMRFVVQFQHQWKPFPGRGAARSVAPQRRDRHDRDRHDRDRHDHRA